MAGGSDCPASEDQHLARQGGAGGFACQRSFVVASPRRLHSGGVVDLNTPEAYCQRVFVFIESSAFDRVRPYYLDDDGYGELQQFMMRNPEAGAVVPGSGGVRKLRWGREGGGKRGGLRVIYYVRYEPNEFWMLTLYAKAKQENVPARILKRLKEAFENE